MDILDKNILKSFLSALLRLDDSLPDDVQQQVNDIGKALRADVAKLSAVAKKHAPLQQAYRDARRLFQKDGERFRSASSVETNDLVDISDEKLMNLAFDILNAEDSVSFVKNAYAESFELRLLLSQLPSGEVVYSVELSGQGDSNPPKTSSPLQAQENTKINIFDLVGACCMSLESGQKVYDLIHPQLQKNKPVELNFTGVKICASPFLSVAIGHLLSDIPAENLDNLLIVSNLNALGEKTYRRVMNTCKQYYSNAEFRSRVDKVRTEILSTLE